MLKQGLGFLKADQIKNHCFKNFQIQNHMNFQITSTAARYEVHGKVTRKNKA